MIRPFFTLVSVVFVFGSPTTWAGDIYVSVAGDDTADGSFGKPFRTVSKAAEMVRPGDTVWIGPGTYRETVRPSGSGEADKRIIFRSLEVSDPVIINGADLVEGPWMREGDSDVYSTILEGAFNSVVGQSEQIFVDGEMFELLRWPKNTNQDLTLPTVAIISEVESYTFGMRGGPMTIRQADFDQPDGRWAGAQAWVNVSPPNKGDGQGMTGLVLSTDLSKNQIIWEGITDGAKAGNHNWGVLAGNQFYLFDPTPEGVMATGGPAAALGEREWWLNRETGRLYVRFPGGSAPENHLVEARRRDWGFDLSSLSYITVRDLNLFAASMTTDSTPAIPKAVFVDSTGVLIDNLRVDYVTHFTDQNIEKDWEAAYAGQSGIVLSGTHHTIRNCRFRWSAGSAISLSGREHRAYNNLLEDFNYQATEAAGINLGKGRANIFSYDHKVGYNTLRSSAGAGIFYVNGKNSDRDFVGMLRIHHNEVYDVLHRMWDIGSFQTVGHDHHGLRIDHNVIHGADDFLHIGIYTDFAGGLHIDHNVVYDSWSPIGGFGSEIFDTPMHNNVSLNGVRRFGFTPGGLSTADADQEYKGLTIFNNIATGNLSDLRHTNSEANLMGSLNTLSALFKDSVNPDMTERDHSLAGGAATAIDAAVPIPGFDDPVSGDAPDIGAYEYGRPKWEAGYGVVPWYFDDDDSLRFAAQGEIIDGAIVLHPFQETVAVENLTVVETSPGVSVELSGTTAAPDTPFELSYSVALDAPAPATGWFILEGTQGELTHEQAFTFRVLPEQQLAEIRLMSELEEFPLILEPREQVHLSIRQYDTDGKVMVTPVPFEWITTGGAWVDANGLLTAGFLQGGPFEAKATSGNVELVVDFHVELDWVREQPVFASASLNGNTLPENAVDSDPKTAWVSGDSNDEWLIIDLGELVELSSIEILWHISLWPKAYTVEISSDGNTWTGVQNTGLTSGGEVILGGMEKVGRWLRIKGGAEAGDFTRIGILNVVVQATSMQDILGAPLTNDPGWRYSQQIFGWIYDLTPGQGPHWVYALEKGWQYILGPGLFLRSDSVWGYSQIDQDWWLFSASRPGEWYLMSRGWEFIIQ